MTKIKGTSVKGNTAVENPTTDKPGTDSIYSILDIFKNINPKYKNILKYIPDEFLNAKQISAKKEALKADDVKYGRNSNGDDNLNDGPSNTSSDDGNIEADTALSRLSDEDMSEAQKVLKDIGKSVGCNIVFEKFIGKDAKSNGYFDKAKRTIHINTEKATVNNALEFVFKHELTHFSEGDSKAYTDFANGVMDSKVFKDWVKSKGYFDSEEISATMAMNSDYIERYKNSGIESLESFDEGAANLEMVADFVGESLFNGNVSKLQKALSGVENKTRNKFMQFVLDLLEKIRNAFKSNSASYESIDSIEAEFVKACKAAKTAYESGVRGEGRQESLKIVKVNGKALTVEPRTATQQDILNYLEMVKSGKLNDDSYFPIRNNTPL